MKIVTLFYALFLAYVGTTAGIKSAVRKNQVIQSATEQEFPLQFQVQQLLGVVTALQRKLDTTNAEVASLRASMTETTALASTPHTRRLVTTNNLQALNIAVTNLNAKVKDIQAKIDTKADKTEVTSKVDGDDIRKKLDTKASIAQLQIDVANLQTLLNLKANQTDIQRALILKADRPDVTILQKNVSDLQASKADKPDVTILQNQKADKTEVPSYSNFVALKTIVDAIEAKTICISSDSTSTNVIFSGCNVHIRNGGDTTASTSVPAGLGNLIIGYNDATYHNHPDPPSPLTQTRGQNERVGSHNIIVGDGHAYTYHSGIVVGYANEITGKYASVTGGYRNIASGLASSISGGNYNKATGYVSSVGGGSTNEAIGAGSSVSSGISNEASGSYSSVSGGIFNKASGDYSSVSGGYNNQASGYYSSVSGGASNQANGVYCSVSGGSSNIASGDVSSVSGGVENTASGNACSVLGGWKNTASGDKTTVTGGKNNQASGARSVVVGNKGSHTGTTCNAAYTICPAPLNG